MGSMRIGLRYIMLVVAIDLNGYYLTDKVSNPTKWQIPSSFIVPPNSVIVIFCSGRDEVIGTSAHSNFKITQTKGNEVVMISDPSQVLLDSVTIRPNIKTHSRGRETDGSSIWSVFVTPTPNATNIGAQLEYAPTPVFSIPPGYFTGSAQVAITCSDPTATIHYTLDGTRPDNNSPIYTVPITFTQTTVLKAITYSTNSNVPPSFIEYNTYFVDDNHTIPILSISGDEVLDLLDGGWGSTSMEPEGTIEWFDKDGNILDKGMGEFNKHGNDSWAYAQRGFDYVMRDQFGYNYALKDKLYL